MHRIRGKNKFYFLSKCQIVPFRSNQFPNSFNKSPFTAVGGQYWTYLRVHAVRYRVLFCYDCFVASNNRFNWKSVDKFVEKFSGLKSSPVVLIKSIDSRGVVTHPGGSDPCFWIVVLSAADLVVITIYLPKILSGLSKGNLWICNNLKAVYFFYPANCVQTITAKTIKLRFNSKTQLRPLRVVNRTSRKDDYVQFNTSEPTWRPLKNKVKDITNLVK